MCDGRRSSFALGVATAIIALLPGTASPSQPVPVSAPGLSCPRVASSPDQFRGVMTRWEINPSARLGGDTRLGSNEVRYSVTPYLSGKPLRDWVNLLESTGVNLGILNLDPSIKLGGDVVPADEWADYLDFLYRRYPDAHQRSVINAVRQKIVNYEYTPEERDQAQLEFLRRLERLKNAGEICGHIRFSVDQRLWFIFAVDLMTGKPIYATPAQILQKEEQFAQDLADFINQARAAGLDHWLIGIRLVEPALADMRQLLPIVLDLAIRVNAATDGWLQRPEHGFIASLGGWGADAAGINSVPCPEAGGGTYQFTCRPGEPLPFFELMKPQTGWFAFSYKFEEFNHGVNYYDQRELSIDGVMRAYCATFNVCDADSLTTDDWVHFLSDPVRGLGFSDLADFIGRNAARHPRHANVIFAGDAWDALQAMTSLPQAVCANPADLCALRAVSRLFTDAAGRSPGRWSGHIFLDGTDDRSTTGVAAGRSDDGRSMYSVRYDPITFRGSRRTFVNQRALKFWRSWPSLPEPPVALQ
jgi:hypothetical protein